MSLTHAPIKTEQAASIPERTASAGITFAELVDEKRLSRAAEDLEAIREDAGWFDRDAL